VLLISRFFDSFNGTELSCAAEGGVGWSELLGRDSMVTRSAKSG